MPIKLSNSAIDTYETCPYKFKLHYKDKIRSEKTFSPLQFGSAFDDAISALLLQKKKDLTPEESALAEQDAFEVFIEAFSVANINGEMVDIRKSNRIEYFRGDCDLELLTDDDLLEIKSQEFDNLIEINADNIAEFVEECKEKMKKKFALSPDAQILFNYICWLSLRNKAELMISAYEDEVLPQIEEVHSIQRKVELPGSDGNLIRGYIDFEATFTDGVRRVIDNKTSSAAYKDDSVRTSQQLAIYSEFAENRECGYIVVHKKLRKKEPRVRIQMVFDTMPEEQLDTVFEKIGEVEAKIEDGYFPKNEDKCFQFGKPCIYYKWCRAENPDGLIKLKKESKC